MAVPFCTGRGAIALRQEFFRPAYPALPALPAFSLFPRQLAPGLRPAMYVLLKPLRPFDTVNDPSARADTLIQ